MTAASRSLATALWGARFASGLLHPSYTINRDTTLGICSQIELRFVHLDPPEPIRLGI